MNNVRLYLLGSPHIEFQGHPIRIERRKAIALAAYLQCAVYRQSCNVLAEMLWPDLDREHGRSALRRGASGHDLKRPPNSPVMLVALG